MGAAYDKALTESKRSGRSSSSERSNATQRTTTCIWRIGPISGGIWNALGRSLCQPVKVHQSSRQLGTMVCSTGGSEQ
ncbi:Cation-independent mannose-6-phosphate receptor [Anopheles sinensis]|uniref:Cation-independent mannose-6-phosphate receptor n=1 Tax=Anopheles sinensis TaxID=74873 RepID=A0A084W5B4_ANOSI|nr:Cation-independent mannose-6-phosphate receptor [Anopheles sinensis]